MIYSMIETARANNLKPFEYLAHLLKALPNVDVKDQSMLDSLMPWSIEIPESCRLIDKSLQQKGQ